MRLDSATHIYYALHFLCFFQARHSNAKNKKVHSDVGIVLTWLNRIRLMIEGLLTLGRIFSA